MDEKSLDIIREVESNPDLNQRLLAAKLDVSLGKTNYMLKKLIEKGFVKVKDFSENPGKAKRLSYFITPSGIKLKIKLTYQFLKTKEAEYNKLKEEWSKLNHEGISY